MRGRESLTALIVSTARGLARAKDLSSLDPFAKTLLPRGLGTVVRAIEPIAATKVGAAISRAGSMGLVSHLALRTHAIDAELIAFVARVERPQVLILGAGSDARGYRLTELSGLPLFEVDHPATQAKKRARAAQLSPRARITYVPVDFERDSLLDALVAAGFARDRATFVIWEGVTMYLTEDAVRSTLLVLQTLLAPESTLAMTYARPELSPAPRATRPLVRAAFALLGEPLRGLFTPAELRGLLEASGFALEHDSGQREWARALGRREPRVDIAERLAVAVRRDRATTRD